MDNKENNVNKEDNVIKVSFNSEQKTQEAKETEKNKENTPKTTGENKPKAPKKNVSEEVKTDKKKTQKPSANKRKPNATKQPVKKARKPKKASGTKKMKAMLPDKKTTGAFIAKNKTSLFFIVLVSIVIIISLLINNSSIISIGNKQVMFSKDYSMSSKADFYVREKNIFYVSKDGMMFLDDEGETLWSDTFTMSSPYMLTEGNFAAVADINNKIVKVYDITGKLYEIAAQGPITTFAVNELGCCAVVSKNNENYLIDVFSNTGEKMFECSRATKDGTPLGIDISDDGSILAITVANYNDLKLKSNVLFFYTNKNDVQTTDSSDGLVSAINIEDSLAAIVSFTSENQCIVASDSALMCIDCTDREFKTNWQREFKNHVTAFSIVKNGCIAVAYGEPVNMTDSDATARQNTISWYNIKGKETGTVRTDERIDNLFASERGTIAAAGKDFTAYTDRGNELWKYSAIQNIKSMQFYNNESSVVIITPTRMQLIDVKKGVTMQEETTLDQSSEETTADNKPTETTTKANETKANE